MQRLRELQTQMAGAVVGGLSEPAANWLHDDAPGAEARLAIYHNHYRVTLIDALTSTFSVVHRLVGDQCFRDAARRYVLTTPPRHPCLHRYGDGFPRHLAGLPLLSRVPYIADVARLEWAVQGASLSEDPAPQRTSAADDPSLGAGVWIGLHPSCRLVCSPFPIDRIWLAHQEGEAAEPVALDAGEVRLLVHRCRDEVGWLRLSAPDAVFVGVLLCEGMPRKALALARLVDPGFEPTAIVVHLLDSGLVSSVSRDLH